MFRGSVEPPGERLKRPGILSVDRFDQNSAHHIDVGQHLQRYPDRRDLAVDEFVDGDAVVPDHLSRAALQRSRSFSHGFVRAVEQVQMDGLHVFHDRQPQQFHPVELRHLP